MKQRRGPAPKLEHPKETLKRVMGFIFLQNWMKWLIVIVCIVFNVIVTIKMTMFLKVLIDSYIVPLLSQQNPDFMPLLDEIIGMGVWMFLAGAAAFLQQRIMVNICQGTMNRLRNIVFDKMQSLPIRYFDTHAHGDIMSLYTNDIDTLRQMISQGIPQIINSGLTVIGVVISMIRLDIPLTVVAFAMIFVMLFVTKKVAVQSGKFFVEQQTNLGRLNGFIEESVSGQKVVKVFCHEDENIAKFNEWNDTLFESAYKANMFGNIIGPINAQFGNLSYVLSAVVGGTLCFSGISGLSIGGLASFLTFNKSLNMPINQISMQINSIISALAGADRIFQLLDEEPEVDEGYVELVNATRAEDGSLAECKNRTGLWAWKHYHKENGTTTYAELKGDVVFEGVDFGYQDDKIVLHDVELYAKPGQKIAFVGATGAGKTTITNLINRFYDIQDGKIRYDGINITKIRKSDLRRSLGIVLQDTHLFSGTIMDNIRYGKLDATDEEVVAAARLANAEEFIKKLPDGYATMIHGDGANLSQGQRQLLAIARAAIADPPVLILDEATSSIDTRTEKIIQKGMDALMKGRTNFVIAHRLSTVRNSDCIMVLEQGRIIERGTHEQLLEMKGKYYQLYTGKTA